MTTAYRVLTTAILAIAATACVPLPTMPTTQKAPVPAARQSSLAVAMGVAPGYQVQKSIPIPADACDPAYYSYTYRTTYISTWNGSVVPAENRYTTNLKKDPSNAKTRANLAIYKGKKIIPAVETPPTVQNDVCYNTGVKANTAGMNDAMADVRALQAQEQPQY